MPDTVGFCGNPLISNTRRFRLAIAEVYVEVLLVKDASRESLYSRRWAFSVWNALPAISTDAFSRRMLALAHPARRKILRMLRDGAMSFTELQKELEIESGHLSYHLRVLNDFIYLEEGQGYKLTSAGQEALQSGYGEPAPTASKMGAFRWPHVNAKGTALLISVMLVASIAYGGYLAASAQNGDLIVGIGGSQYLETASNPFIVQDAAGYLYVYYASYIVNNYTSNLKVVKSTHPFVSSLSGGFSADFDVPKIIGHGTGPIWVARTNDGSFVMLYHQYVPPGENRKPTLGILYRTSSDGLVWGAEGTLIEEPTWMNGQDPYWAFALVQGQDGAFWLTYTSAYRNTVEIRSGIHLQDLLTASSSTIVKYSPASLEGGCPAPCSQPTLVAMTSSKTGALTVLWTVSTFTGNSANYAPWISLSQNGQNWSPPKKISISSMMFNTFLTLAPDGSYVMVWGDNNISDGTVYDKNGVPFIGKPTANIWVSKSTDGVTWTGPEVIARTNGAAQPKLTMLPNGGLAVVSDGPGSLWFLLRGSPFDALAVPEMISSTFAYGIAVVSATITCLLVRRNQRRSPVEL